MAEPRGTEDQLADARWAISPLADARGTKSPLADTRGTGRRGASCGLCAPVILAALILGHVACKDDLPGGAVDPYLAPGIDLVDLNPASPTYMEELSMEDALGGVLVVYFASFT